MGRRKYPNLFPTNSEVAKEYKKMFKEIAKLNEPKKEKVDRKRFRKWTKLTVLIWQNNLCKICSTDLAGIAEFDHIDGDSTNNDISNCQALCPNCHTKKTRKPQQASWSNFNWFQPIF